MNQVANLLDYSRDSQLDTANLMPLTRNCHQLHTNTERTDIHRAGLLLCLQLKSAPPIDEVNYDHMVELANASTRPALRALHQRAMQQSLFAFDDETEAKLEQLIDSRLMELEPSSTSSGGGGGSSSDSSSSSTGWITKRSAC
jgi:hypothetical protein